jgi:hypothetical protein
MGTPIFSGMNGANRHVIFRLFIPYGEHRVTLYD